MADEGKLYIVPGLPKSISLTRIIGAFSNNYIVLYIISSGTTDKQKKQNVDWGGGSLRLG